MTRNSRFQDKICLITGGARGLGLATAQALIAEGARVMITDRDAAAGHAAAAALGDRALFATHDVTDAEQWRAVLDRVASLWDHLDVLVNNAGVGSIVDIERVTQEDWRRTLAVNLDGVFLGTQAAVARMKQRGGAIVNVASIEGLVGDPGLPAYNASKGAVRLLTRSVALHCARSGYRIRANSICPGFVATQLVTDALGALAPDDANRFGARVLERIPMGRFGEPAEIAAAILFLACDESSYITGADLIVDGGYTAS